MNENSPILELRNITKAFPGVVANREVSVSIQKGEIHAIVGENGAGKSTLIKIAAGLYQPDSGEIIVEGSPRHFRNALDAFGCGIAAVHQDFMLVGSLSVLENIVLGFEPGSRLWFLDRKEAASRVSDLAQEYGMKVPSLTARVANLPVAVQQRVEILKALYKNARILILDEPTSVLTPQEIQELFGALKSLKALGTTVVFITHKLNEVLAIADRVTVMRAGAVQGTLPVSQVDEEKLARMMVGREVVFRIRRAYKQARDAESVLEAKQVSLKRDAEHWLLKDINLSVARGEILGLAGVAGNGQAELVDVVTGLRRPTLGRVSILGEDFAFVSTARFRQGSSYVPQNRREVGSSPNQSIWENVIIGLQGKPDFSTPPGVLRKRPILQYAREIVERFDVRTPSVSALASHLSGGNLQKLILGRELSKKPSLLVAQDPTRGLDVGATEYVRDQILKFASADNGVFLVSQDLNEILMLSDRIVIIFNGEIVGELSGEEATAELVGLYMMGLKRQETAHGTEA